MTKEDLTKMKIICTGYLVLKEDNSARIAETASLGQGEFWCSETLHRQLDVLDSLISRKVGNDPSISLCYSLPQTEASARTWIDTFFFRTSAMLLPDIRMVLNMELDISASITLSSLSTILGFIDYTAIITSDPTTGKSALAYINHQVHYSLQLAFLK
jgi:hypothetical protein